MTEKPISDCTVCAQAGDGTMCGDKHAGYICTRPHKHTGDHSACSLHAHEIITWQWPAPITHNQ